MSRRLLWVCIWALLIGCDDDQPSTGEDTGPADASGDLAPDPEPDMLPDPEPDAAIAGRVRIVAPMAGARLSGADDLEPPIADGLQVEVAVEAEGSDDGLVRIVVDDLEYRGEYGIEDTRQALYEARREGIHAYCITIDREGQDYLPHMYGAANFTVLDDVAKLPTRISDIYRRITS